jgi:hypothetical protein
MATLVASAPPGSVWAVADLDAKAAVDSQTSGNAEPYLLKTPAHGNVRSFVYFDSHSAAKRVTTPDAY